MLDFLLVLGKVPGTNIYITFIDIEIVLWALLLRWTWRLHRKEYVRWLKWYWYRTCVNYRKTKRTIYRFYRRRRHALRVIYQRARRQIRLTIRRARRQARQGVYRTYSYQIKRRWYKERVKLDRVGRRVKRAKLAPVSYH